MRVLLWHGWLLDATGSNIYTARVADALRSGGHDVLLLCQDPHPEVLPFVDAVGDVGGNGPPDVSPTAAAPAEGRLTVLRPRIGDLLPVFVYDEYEGFRVRPFVDLTQPELAAYLERNVLALRAAAAWHQARVVVANHAVPGPVVAARALGPGSHVAVMHGSDLEYAVRPQPRYRDLAAEGLAAARSLAGASVDVLERTVSLVPEAAGIGRVVASPAVDMSSFRPRPRRRGLEECAALLEQETESDGRTDRADQAVAAALDARDPEALARVESSYDQSAPDTAAPERLRMLAPRSEPVVGYIGKLIPQKGVELYLEALALLGPQVRGLVVGFGTFRDRLAALLLALDRGDPAAARWVGRAGGLPVDLSDEEIRGAAGIGGRVVFTGRIEHRYAPPAVAAMDVLVVPSRMPEAFGTVAIEGAAAGAIPVVARHSALGEVAARLEGAIGRPGLLSFHPDDPHDLAARTRAILALGARERGRLSATLREAVGREWSWDRTAEILLGAGTAPPGPGTPIVRPERDPIS